MNSEGRGSQSHVAVRLKNRDLRAAAPSQPSFTYSHDVRKVDLRPFRHYDPFERGNRRRDDRSKYRLLGRGLMRHRDLWAELGRAFAGVVPVLAVALPVTIGDAAASADHATLY